MEIRAFLVTLGGEPVSVPSLRRIPARYGWAEEAPVP